MYMHYRCVSTISTKKSIPSLSSVAILMKSTKVQTLSAVMAHVAAHMACS